MTQDKTLQVLEEIRDNQKESLELQKAAMESAKKMRMVTLGIMAALILYLFWMGSKV